MGKLLLALKDPLGLQKERAERLAQEACEQVSDLKAKGYFDHVIVKAVDDVFFNPKLPLAQSKLEEKAIQEELLAHHPSLNWYFREKTSLGAPIKRE